MTQTAEEETHAHNKEQVGQNRSEHRGLNDLNLVILQCDNADLCNRYVSQPCPIDQVLSLGMAHDQLHSITKRGIEQASHCLAELQRDLLGSVRQDCSERYDGEEVDRENSGRVPARSAGNNANGDSDEEEVHVV